MKKFPILITKTSTYQAVVEIDAENEEAARWAAVEKNENREIDFSHEHTETDYEVRE